MPNGTREKTRLGIYALIGLTILVLFAGGPLRKLMDYVTDYYRGQPEEETLIVGGILGEMSPSEQAHNENYFGVGRLDKGDYEGAVEKFSLAVELDPGSPEYHRNLGIAYEKDGQHGNAVEAFGNALTLEPENHDTVTLLAGAYFGNQQWRDSADAYDRAIQLGAHNDRTYFNAAQAYLENGSLIRAIGAIDSAIELNGKDPDYYRVSGIVKCGFGRYEEAMKDFKAAEGLDPEDSDTKEWIKFASAQLEEGGSPETDYESDRHKDEFYEGLDKIQQRKVDDLHRRMNRLKEELLGK